MAIYQGTDMNTIHPGATAQSQTIIDYVLNQLRQNSDAHAYYHRRTPSELHYIKQKLNASAPKGSLVLIDSECVQVVKPTPEPVPSDIANAVQTAIETGSASFNGSSCSRYFPKLTMPELWLQTLLPNDVLFIKPHYQGFTVTRLNAVVPDNVNPSFMFDPTKHEDVETAFRDHFQTHGVVCVNTKALATVLDDKAHRIRDYDSSAFAIDRAKGWIDSEESCLINSISNPALYFLVFYKIDVDIDPTLDALDVWVKREAAPPKEYQPIPGAEYTHHSGKKYRCVALANMDVPSRKGFDPTVVYERRIDGEMHTYTRLVADFVQKFTGPYKEMS